MAILTPSALLPPILRAPSKAVPVELILATTISNPSPAKAPLPITGNPVAVFGELVRPVKYKFCCASTTKLCGCSFPDPPK